MKRLIAFFLLLALLLLSACSDASVPGVTTAETTANTTAGTTTAGTTTVGETTPDATTSGETPPAPVDPFTGEDFEIGRNFPLTFAEADRTRILGVIAEAEKMIVEGTDYPAFEALYDRLYDTEMDWLASQNQIAYIRFCLLQNDREISDSYVDLDSFYGRCVKDIYTMYETVWQSPFRDSFYEDWTDSEIAEARALAASYTDEVIALSDDNNRILVEYRALNQNDADFGLDSAVLYLQTVENNNRIARLMGYDDYMEYAYRDVYGRDYTPGDVETFRDLIAEYLVPLLKAVNSDLSLRLQTATAAQIGTIYRFLNGDFRTSEIGGYMDAYIEAVNAADPITGETFARAYDDLWKGGNYFLAFNEGRSFDGAFTTYLYDTETPVTYFGPNCRNLFTAIHEFGHYFAAYIGGESAMVKSYDLSESQSQGNECLLISMIPMLTSEADPVTKSAIGLFTEYKLYSMLVSTVICMMVDEFESYVYTHENLSAADLDGIYRDICERYIGCNELGKILGYAPELYWHYVTIESPGYYISYAMSAIPALTIFALAREEGMARAVSAYMTLAAPGEDCEFLDAIAAAGMATPMEAASFRLILEAVGGYLNLRVSESVGGS